MVRKVQPRDIELLFSFFYEVYAAGDRLAYVKACGVGELCSIEQWVQLQVRKVLITGVFEGFIDVFLCSTQLLGICIGVFKTLREGIKSIERKRLVAANTLLVYQASEPDRHLV